MLDRLKDPSDGIDAEDHDRHHHGTSGWITVVPASPSHEARH
jgi:hypothetical protein